MVPLAEIVAEAGPPYLEAYGDRMLPSHRRALTEIVACRTPAMGGSVYECDDEGCRAVHFAYHSCGNRHCPQCQTEKAELWYEKVRTLFVPCPYYFLTFTLPSELRKLARSEQKLVYGLLLGEAARSIQELATDRQWVGGLPGMLAVLHTWSRTLAYHPHAHLLVTAGGYDEASDTWLKPARPDFLMPGFKLGSIFRRRIRFALKKVDMLTGVPAAAWQKKWIVHVAHAGTGEKVAEYLSRYVFRIALHEHQIEAFENGLVTFRYTHSRTREQRRLVLPAERFLAQFLQHVLPRGFTKIRYYGIWANTNRERLDRSRDLLAQSPLIATPKLQPEVPSTINDNETKPISTGEQSASDTSLPQCPVCGRGRLHLIGRTSRSRSPPW